MMIKNVKQILNKAWVLLMMIVLSCNAQDKSSSNTSELNMNTNWLKEFRSKGGKTYLSFDEFKLLPKNEFLDNEFKKNTILYGVIDNDSLIHLTICNTDNFKKTLFEYKSYYKISDSIYTNTKIYCESDINLCSRTVTIKRKSDVVYYEYFIHNDREYLNSIRFLYGDGKEKIFEQKKFKYLYIDYDVNIIESQVPKDWEAY
jgi:hypothetical protein